MLLTVKDLMKLLNIGRDFAYRLMHAKDFPSIKFNGRYVVLDTEVKKYLQSKSGKEVIL